MITAPQDGRPLPESAGVLALPRVLQKRVCAARIARDAALLHGRLLCGAHATCAGYLGRFYRSYTRRGAPAGFPALHVDFVDASERAEDECIGDLLRFWLPNGYYRRPAAGSDLQWFAYSERARLRRRAGQKPAVRRDAWPDELDLDPHPNALIECPACRALNLVNCAVVDRQIALRYQALDFELRIHACIVRRDGRPPFAEFDYLVRPKGMPAEEWELVGGERGRLGVASLEEPYRCLTAAGGRRDRRDYRGTQEDDERERWTLFLLGENTV